MTQVPASDQSDRFREGPNRPLIRHRRWRKGKSLCAYCGVEVCTTSDHPIPDNLYTAELRKRLQMLTIPACDKCNFAKSQVDNTLRDYLVGDVDSSQHSIAEQIFNSKMETAITENHVRLLDNFYRGTSIPAFTREGNFDTFVYAISIDDEPLLQAVTWVARGMHWQVFGESIAADNTSVRLVDRYKREDLVVQLAVLGFAGHFILGDPFTCGWVVGEQGTVFWVLSFFDSVVFLARTRLSEEALRAHNAALQMPSS